MYTFFIAYKKEEYDKAHELSNHCDQHSLVPLLVDVLFPELLKSFSKLLSGKYLKHFSSLDGGIESLCITAFMSSQNLIYCILLGIIHIVVFNKDLL